MASQFIDLGNTNNTITPIPPDDDYIIIGGNGDNTVTLGNGNDQFILGNGSNTLTVGNGTNQVGVGDGNNTVTTGNGRSTISVGNGNNTLTVGTGSNTIGLGTGLNTVHTGAGDNVVSVSAGAVSGDVIMGALTSGDGSTNRLVLTTAGTMSPVNVSGFQTYQLADSGPNSLTLVEANFERLPDGSITVIGGDSGDTIDASVLSAAHSVTIFAGAGTDVLTGGAGDDVFVFAPGNTSGDTVDGGAGSNTLNLAAGGAGTLTGLGTNFVNIDTVFLDDNAIWTIGISDPAAFTGTISGFGADDAIDLASIPFDSSGTATILSGNVLRITANGSVVDLQLDPNQNFSGHTFALGADAGGGTIITEETGGQFLFGLSSGFAGVTLGFNDGTNPISPPVAGSFNIEVFTSLSVGDPLPALDTGFQAGLIDNGGFLLAGGFLTGRQLQLFTGDYKISNAGPSGSPAEIILGSGNQTVIGAAGDTLIGGSGNQVLDARREPGAESIVGGTGAYTVFGGVGSTVIGSANANSGTTGQIFGAADMTVVLPTAGNYTIFGGQGDTITAAAGAANVQIGGAPFNLIDLTGNSGNAIINAVAGGETVIAGIGNTSIFGGNGDSIVAGASGSTYIDGQFGLMTIVGGSGGSNIIIGSINPGAAGADTIVGNGAANLEIQGLGNGDVVDLTKATGSGTVNAMAGNNSVTLGSGAASVYGGVGDTITFGTGSQYVDGSAGGMTIRVGSGGAGVVDTVIGSGGDADTILGGSSSLSYNPQVGGSGDLIDLSGSTGNATVNAFSAGGADTILGGNGSDSVWGGGGDRIGVGNSAGAGGTHLFGHSTNAPGAAIGFGTNDTVVATSYDTVAGTATIDATVAGASSARVTIGGAAGNFDNLTDFIFYQNETDQTNSAIVATSQSSGGGASSIITLPDGTVMTLLGITQSELQTALTAGTLFQA